MKLEKKVAPIEPKITLWQPTKINLLDWRAARRETRRKQFLTFLGIGVAAAIGVVVLGLLAMNQAVARQQQRNEYLRQQISEIDQKIKEIQELEKVKANLLARMRIIEALQSSRSATVHFFDELVNTLPEGITLTVIKQNGDTVNVEGVAESNGRVASYMKSLDASEWFADPKLIVIKTTEKNKVRSSSFILQVKNLTKSSLEEQASVAKEAANAASSGTPAAEAPPSAGTAPAATPPAPAAAPGAALPAIAPVPAEPTGAAPASPPASKSAPVIAPAASPAKPVATPTTATPAPAATGAKP